MHTNHSGFFLASSSLYYSLVVPTKQLVGMSVIAKVMQVPEVLVTLVQEVLHIQVPAVPPMMDPAVLAIPVLVGIDIRVLVVLPKTKSELARQINSLGQVEINVLEPIDKKNVGLVKSEIDRCLNGGQKSLSVILIKER